MPTQYEQIFTTEQVINHPIQDVFHFFSRAENLQRITPPLLDFKIVSPLPIDMKQGALIDYRLKLRGLPIGWRTLIESWEPPFRFIDTQIKGPYKLWHHTHLFKALNEKQTHMTDIVKYEVPLKWLGLIANRLLVRKDIEEIFKYRRQEIENIFAR